MAEAIAAVDGKPTHIWISLGGNDYMTPSENAAGAAGSGAGPCEITRPQLKDRFQKVIDKVKAAAAAASVTGYKIVMTGYCVPWKPECDGKTDMTTLLTMFLRLH